MRISPRVSPHVKPVLTGSLLWLCLVAYVLVQAPRPAAAAGPATVTVRVVGASGQSLLPLTQVTTTTTPVVKEEHGKPEGSCTGTSAAGALELATKGNWGGEWNASFGYGVETIEGVSYPFTQPDFWDFWLDNKSSEIGVCGAELNQGDSVLFFVECFSKTAGVCPSTPPNVLAIEAPATVEVGKPVTVTVLSYPNPGGEPKPMAGAHVGGWSSSTVTDSMGHATLVFPGDATYTLRATGASGESEIPGEAFVCAHEGNDGTCGTTAPTHHTEQPSPSTPGPRIVTNSPPVLQATIVGVRNGHVYTRRSAPRLLRGVVVLPAGTLLRSVRISLKRRYHGHCFGFNGAKVRFVRLRCGKPASFFSVGTQASFSYLLPARLPRGLYTYDIEAVDAAGHTTKLVGGVSRVVFRVR